ncbi:hypothetical protein, partial [Nocardia sp. NPDC003648]
HISYHTLSHHDDLPILTMCVDVAIFLLVRPHTVGHELRFVADSAVFGGNSDPAEVARDGRD